MPLASLDDIVWGAWDLFPDDAYVAATRAGVLEGGKHLEQIADVLRDIRPMPAAFERATSSASTASNIDGTSVASGRCSTASARTSTASATRTSSTGS